MSQLLTIASTGSGGGSVSTLTGDSGGPVSPTGGNINIVGGPGVSVAGNPGTSTLTINVSGSGLTWNSVTVPLTALAANNGYVINFTGTAVLNLPATTTLGDTIEIIQNEATVGSAHQVAANGNTLVDTAGSHATLTFTNTDLPAGTPQQRYGSIKLVAIANNKWSVFQQPTGTYVAA